MKRKVLKISAFKQQNIIKYICPSTVKRNPHQGYLFQQTNKLLEAKLYLDIS